MVVVLLSEAKGPGFAARLRAAVLTFSRGRQGLWVPAVPGKHTPRVEDFPPDPVWPDDVKGTVSQAGESLGVPGGDPGRSSGPSAGEEEGKQSRLFRVQRERAVADGLGRASGHRPAPRRRDKGGDDAVRRRCGRWKRYFPREPGP